LGTIVAPLGHLGVSECGIVTGQFAGVDEHSVLELPPGRMQR
jgi:hypothetical protein